MDAIQRADRFHEKKDLRVKSAVLAPEKIDLKGRCSKQHPYNPLYKQYRDTVRKTANIFCDGNRRDTNSRLTENYFADDLERIATVALRRAGFDNDQRGTVASARATSRRAVIVFREDRDTDASTEPYEQLIITRDRASVRRYE